MRSTAMPMECFFFLSSFGGVVEPVELAVDHHPGEPPLLELGPELLVLALPVLDERRHDGGPGAGGQRQDLLADALRGLGLDLLAADRAVLLPDPRPEDAHVVVDLGDGAHRRARVPGRALLLDGDGGGEPPQPLDAGPLHLPEELPGVGAEALDVAPLTLRRRACRRPATTLPEPLGPVKTTSWFLGTDRYGTSQVVLPGALDDDLLGFALPVILVATSRPNRGARHRRAPYGTRVQASSQRLLHPAAPVGPTGRACRSGRAPGSRWPRCR
jgi:hypothetical protein